MLHLVNAPGAPRPPPDLYFGLLDALRWLFEQPEVGSLLEEEPGQVYSAPNTTGVCVDGLLGQASPAQHPAALHRARFRSSQAHTESSSCPPLRQLMSSGIHYMGGDADDLKGALWATLKALLLAAPTAGMLALLSHVAPRGNGPLASASLNLKGAKEPETEEEAEQRTIMQCAAAVVHRQPPTLRSRWFAPCWRGVYSAMVPAGLSLAGWWQKPWSSWQPTSRCYGRLCASTALPRS